MTFRPNRESFLLLPAVSVLSLGLLISVFRAGHLQSQPPVPAPTTPAVRSEEWHKRSLTPVPNPDPDAQMQLARCHPHRVALTLEKEKAYVTLSGTESQPGSTVAVLDVPGQSLLREVTVGSSPNGMALHPSGKWIVVANRFSNFLSVIETGSDRVVAEIPVPFYCEDLIISPDGKQAFVSNFWKNQVLFVDLETEGGQLGGTMRELGFDRDAFFGQRQIRQTHWSICDRCLWRSSEEQRCRYCESSALRQVVEEELVDYHPGLMTALRAGCGTTECHLHNAGGFYAGPDRERSLHSAIVHSFPADPDGSPLLRAVTSIVHGGWAEGVDGRHHPGGVVFNDPEGDPDYRRLKKWIAEGSEGPGIAVGDKPRDLALSSDGRTLYVANTGSLDISVIDLQQQREMRRIFTRSPVNDLVWMEDRLILATLGVGSGHPKARHAGRESRSREDPEAEFSLFRDHATGKPLPLAQQEPLGPYDDVDGTLQEKFRDITNDIVLLRAAADNVAAYRATEDFTRYTSDSFESLPGDKKGDVAAELMKVVGAFPEQIARDEDRLFVTMSGTFQVQEWIVDLTAAPAERLQPGRLFTTGFKPAGIAFADHSLIVANMLDESVSFIDLKTGRNDRLSLRRSAEPFPANDFERGEFFVQSSVFSVDQDQSCVHCHYRDTSDGKRWSVSQVMGQSRNGEERTGGSREVPDIRVLFHKVPFFLEGILSMDEPLTMMMEHNPLVDFQGVTPAGSFDDILADEEESERYSGSADSIVVATGRTGEDLDVRLVDLIKRRETHFRQIAKRYLGEEYQFRDFQKFIGAYQAGEPRLLPNPRDKNDPMIVHGRELFHHPMVACASCHPAPAFTDKSKVYNQNKSFPPLVTAAPRDNVHTLISADRIDALNGYVRYWDQKDKGRIETQEGFFVAPSLRGLWARPPRLLHHGHAISLREVVCSPDHVALRRFPFARRDADRPERHERGLNELDGVPDTHGVTSHLSVWDIECLISFIQSIE